MNKTFPTCTQCSNELRQEYYKQDSGWSWVTGYCGKCAKHFNLCGKVQHMNHCIRLRDHVGEHKDGNNNTWSGDRYK